MRIGRRRPSPSVSFSNIIGCWPVAQRARQEDSFDARFDPTTALPGDALWAQSNSRCRPSSTNAALNFAPASAISADCSLVLRRMEGSSVEADERATAPSATVLFRRTCANFAGAGHRSRIATGLSMPPQWQLLAQHRNSMMGAGVK